MVFKEDRKHLKIQNSKMDYLHKESVYWEHRPPLFNSNTYRSNNSVNDKMFKRPNYYYKDTIESSSDYPSFFTSKTYSNMNNSILSYIVGGFVGSKIQMNNNKKHNFSYDLSAAISNLLNPWKCEQERVTSKGSNINFGGVSSVIHGDCYKKYMINKSESENANEKEKNCLMDMVDIECLITIPLKDFVEEQHCILDYNKNCSESYLDEKNRDMYKINDSNICDTNQINSSIHSKEDIPTEKKLNCEIQCYLVQDTNNEMHDSSEKVMGKSSMFNGNAEELSEIPELLNSCDLVKNLEETKVPNKCDSQVLHSSNYLANERFRQQSECSVESTDSESFIVFEDHLDDDCDDDDDVERDLKNHKKVHYSDIDSDAFSDDDDDDDDEDEDEEEEDEYECVDSSSSDEYDFCSISKNILLANDKWLRNYHDVNVEENESLKKVKFNDVVKVNRIFAWDHAYRTARLGPWEQMARDRVRFRERISRLSPIISPVLNSDHRKRMYEKLQS